MTALNLPCGKDLNHLRIQSGDGLNLTAFLDHLESSEKCSQCQGEVVISLPACDSGLTMITPLPLQMSCWPFQSAPVLRLPI
jgi:hypothetical protein